MKINIKGPIIPSSNQWIYDWFGIDAVSPKKISDHLMNANNQDLEVEINSSGGSVFDASEIYTALKDYSGNVTVKIVGIAASAASVIAMAGNKIMMSPTSQMMIHNASVMAQGDYRDMDQASGFLKNVNQTIANAYSLKSGKSYDELLSMMDAETWLTPQQALEHNLIDEIMFGQSVQVVGDAGTGTGLLPQEVIDKMRNQMSKSNPPVTNQVTTQSTKEENEIMNLEQLKNDYSELYQQIRNDGYEAGVNAENSRIKAIEELQMPGNESLINKAKFETKDTAENVAIQIIKAEKQRGQNFLQNRQEDGEELDQVAGSAAPENNGKSDNVKADEQGKNIANFINKMRGGVK
ncbi:head maturation protease, ClpP-related [Neobacillus mesonae]|uniref:head maturation protease, ClpP-related n=1 Tax=Neobacillus mesonae TaxID=1193713 RepID=UPI00203D4164|nr:head maturation protease, ClpP-related [Neobacillus mesonae]MCM3567859.1 Clp protease ClpP [Neobacillus mesonae]